MVMDIDFNGFNAGFDAGIAQKVSSVTDVDRVISCAGDMKNDESYKEGVNNALSWILGE